MAVSLRELAIRILRSATTLLSAPMNLVGYAFFTRRSCAWLCFTLYVFPRRNVRCPLSEAHERSWAFVCLEITLTFIAYLDEFGHIGPFVSRNDPKYNESPVFGFAGYLLPLEEVRSFGTWFFQRKCELLDYEIKRSGKHPALWEKKGAALYTVRNVTKYPELRKFTFRLLNEISKRGGHTFYVGIKKHAAPEDHRPNQLYIRMLLEAIKRLDEFCAVELTGDAGFMLALDEHEQRSEMLTAASKSMYGTSARRRHLIEPPFHLESHRYQTVQAADWIAGLVGRLGAYWADSHEYSDNKIHRKYFESRLADCSLRSGVRLNGGKGTAT